MNTITKRLLAAALGVAGSTWLGVLATLTARQHRFIFNPLSSQVPRPRSNGHRCRPVVLRSSDGTRLCGWLLTPRSPGRHPAAIYFGGRSEEVSWVIGAAETMFPDMAVLAVNYRGYGDSHGQPSERHLIGDAQMLFDWFAGHSRINAEKIAIIGRSLGSGVALQLAAQRPVAAIALLTPYDSILAIAQRRFRSMPISLVLKHRFESIKVAEKISAPVLVLRAESDDVVPRAHTDALVAKLHTVRIDQTIPESNHFNIPFLPATQQRVASYLTDLLFASEIEVPQPATALATAAFE
ncbi:alpha/beta hydrolase [Noviherbaspirillum saxi]|uniref:Alpha/beta fold hydrolase n=1 Tax=Noviherbaspirillum saxi TaxID=2320863 RepID=A0A3A3FFU3_9BURK|nr:alpha/beta fold hydrolase [Noviherbaspirillum saxi]RJF91937.1 alpha/beta fold hydrolase [Noviherbaspirillum saxi]